MIIKKVETEKEVMMMCAMKASSNAQNEAIKQMYQEGALCFEDCFIAIEQEKVVARAIMLETFLGFYTVEKIPLKQAILFVEYVLQTCGKKEILTHLYADKTYYALVEKSLVATGFTLFQEKESFVCKVKKLSCKLTSKDGNEIEKAVFVAMIKQVLKEQKDRGIYEDVKQMGVEQASLMLYGESCPSFYLAGFHNDEMIGFVILTQLSNKIAGIQYIGVLPEYRGHAYSCELLKLATNLADQYGYEEMIADVDVENTAMLNNVLQAGYYKSCNMKAFVYKQSL
ncbi:MAG: GNAT family N-acetyltransferase [Erysipelotrichia bacterium]|nr:GNAT family N-acetyltransferase [Erysipelotrichia bacterium]NCC54300.1 GNAT family N-acetyltransferase [Erysipelotrichia bacterium]